MAELNTVHLTLPAATDDLRKLQIGTVAYLSGRIFTAREGVYKRAIEDGAGMPAARDALGLATSTARRRRASMPTAATPSAPSPPPPRSASRNGSTAGSNSPAATSSSARAE